MLDGRRFADVFNELPELFRGDGELSNHCCLTYCESSTASGTPVPVAAKDPVCLFLFSTGQQIAVDEPVQDQSTLAPAVGTGLHF